MSKLQEQLAGLKERVEGNMPPGFLRTMHGATQQLIQSGIEDRVLKVGDEAPSFRLENQNGEVMDSAELLRIGPLVLTFYRGFW